MALVVTTQGEIVLLESLLGINPLVSVTYHLYANNWIPSVTDTLADYLEVSLTGYAPISIPAAAWAVIADNLGGAIGTAPEIAWLITQAGPAYGYYVTDPADTVLLWAEAIPGGPYTFLADGSSFSLTPSFSAD